MYTPTFRWGHELGREPEARLGDAGSGEAEGGGATGARLGGGPGE
jgi:hypothetical protein